MKRSFFVTVGLTVVLAATAAAQDITVVGTGDPTVDVPAVQAAVDQGGRVVLNGHFSFDAPPTAAEQPDGFLGAAVVAPAQSTNIFSPALCSCRRTTSSFDRQRWYKENVPIAYYSL